VLVAHRLALVARIVVGVAARGDGVAAARVAPRRRLGVRAGSSKSISTVHRRFGMVITAVPSLRFNAGRTPDDVER
jgi:hypothetical protein